MVWRRRDDGLTGVLGGARRGVEPSCGFEATDDLTLRSTRRRRDRLPRAVKSAGVVGWAMSADLVPPGERECVRCGRREAWDEDVATWAVDGEAVGEVHCVHEWDINGTYSPFR